ncbi:uncharacterized protein YigE (DUF2233 family) [Palleronia aestuarii]|uniref:Uncharacterized protein YigE (DUF2233 family) n=1 Tax=Palleronia aestuarii TaxID=568105 RepID=A0A2W7Q1V4_9RHOB|nr:phosphodiester glycosidase family protein [Palleronia aestuarii]PZX15819.1 uncharacterized protein YigE (DUF2233 family) [Palleronia aestuarii]
MWKALLMLLMAPAAAQAAECRSMVFDGASFTACPVDLETEELRLWRADASGAPYGSFRSVDRALDSEGARLGVAMNAGMYHADRSPVGLYTEDGVEEAGIVTSEGPGNFGMLPNGVLCLQGDRARIVESRAFAADPPACRYATQSGPMLVIGGALHPRFLPDGTSTYVRNGAGVSADGRTLWLVISDARVTFHHFARFFRDALGTPDALYLDGNVSRLYDSHSGRHDAGMPMGPIIGTVERH